MPLPPPVPLDQESASLASETPASQGGLMENPAAEGPSGDGWKLESLSARRTKNGGIVVTCSKKRDGGEQQGGPVNAVSSGREYDSNEYSYTDPAEALAFIAQELGVASPAAAAPVDDADY